MRVLVTGGTGFLGSHLCRRMVADGHDVHALYRSASELPNLEGLPLKTLHGDITDADAMRAVVRGREWVVHAAADLSYWGPHAGILHRVNADGTRNVVRACRLEGVARMVFVSSVLAVGIPADPASPAAEGFAYNLEGHGLPYADSKRRGERIVTEEISHGLDAVTVNPALIVGPHGAGYQGAEMLRKVRRGRIVPYFSGGICMVHVEDVAAGILGALERGTTGLRYILGGDNLTYREIVDRTAAGMGLSRRFVRVPPALTGLLALAMAPAGRLRGRPPRFSRELHYLANRHRFYDSRLARESLGYRPRGFDSILEECLRLGLC